MNKIITLLGAVFVSISSLAQDSNNLNKIVNISCCNGKINKNKTTINSNKYSFECKKNNEIYFIITDSLGKWIRTYQPLEKKQIPKSCFSSFEVKKEELEKEFIINNPTPNGKINTYKITSIVKEYNEATTFGYYNFKIEKTIRYKPLFKDSATYVDTKSIKIGFDCELLNNDGKKVVQISGKPLIGYEEDSLNLSSTTTIEYYNGMKNGLFIQYFNYPNEIASVNYYENDKLKGPYYQYHKNGNTKEIGLFVNGIKKALNKWDENGTSYLFNFKMDTNSNLYSNNYNQLLNGKFLLINTEIFFSKGKIDSTVVKDLNNKICTNFIDSSITTTSFDNDGFRTSIKFFKLKSIDIEILQNNNNFFISYKTKYSNNYEEIKFFDKLNIVKERCYISFPEKEVEKCYNYNKKGELIKE